jgi:hypothetical protein
MIKRVIMMSGRRHGFNVDQYGKGVDDYAKEAFVLLLERRRHFPHYRARDLERFLLKFLLRTVDNLVSHSGDRTVKEGQRLSLIRRSHEAPGTGEYMADHLVSREPDPETILLDRDD